MLEQKAMEEIIESYRCRLLNMGYTEDMSNKLSAILFEMYLWELKNPTKHELDAPDQNQYGWYVQSLSCGAYYLHKDGEVKYGAETNDGSSGYFNSYSEAIEAISTYNRRSNI